jgi:hypothetical protein
MLSPSSHSDGRWLVTCVAWLLVFSLEMLTLSAFRKYLDNIRKGQGGFTDESYEIDEDGNSTSGGRIHSQEQMKIL